MQAVRHAGHGGGCDGGALQHCEAVRHKQTLCIGAPGRFEIEVGLRGMCILDGGFFDRVKNLVSKRIYQQFCIADKLFQHSFVVRREGRTGGDGTV